MDLKPYMDAVTAAQDAALDVAGRIDALFTDGKVKEALALQQELDEAEARVQGAEKLYNAMARVTDRSTAAPKFVPVSEPDRLLEEEPEEDPKAMKRAAFDQMNALQQSKFVLGGGRVVDNDEEE